MKKRLSVLLVLLMTIDLIMAQVTLTGDQVKLYSDIPQESIFVHFNTSLLLTGEYLYYKIYCLNNEEGRLSDLSKIAYVELVGKDGKPIFKHKILLDDGQGQGDFFIPTAVPSGNYKLLAFTNWMRNKKNEQFFQSDITIVNPYQANQSSVRSEKTIAADTLETSLLAIGPKKDLIYETSLEFGPLRLSLKKQTFRKRDRVSLLFSPANKSNFSMGAYSISVRKKDGIPAAIQQNSISIFESSLLKRSAYGHTIANEVYLPELRGELLAGKVIGLNESKSIKNLKVAVSIPGKDYYFDVVETDELGNFHLNVHKFYSGNKIVLEVLSERPEEYLVSIKTMPDIGYSDIEFNKIDLAPSMKEEILRRSVHNQIENSYFQFRPDSILSISPIQFFYNKKKEVYNLDDYTRFRSLQETVLEIIKDVSANRVGQDNYVLRVKGFDYTTTTNLLPLILLDGVLIQDHNAILGFDAREIKDITVLRHKFVVGPEIFQGALVLSTENGNGFDQLLDPNSVSEIFKPQPNKNYFVQRYDGANNITSSSRLPDDRLQLLWLPKLRLTGKSGTLDFFTSDVEGEFEIHLEGFTQEHEPVSIRKSIFVN